MASTTVTNHTRRRFTFSLRMFFALVTLLTIWLGMGIYRAQQQEAAIVAIEAIDGYYYYDYQYDPPNIYCGDRPPPGPAWLWRYIDQDLCFDVAAVDLNSKPATDETMELNCRLRHLEQLDLAGASKDTDRGLKTLISLKSLSYLRLDGTSVSESVLPQSEVEFSLTCVSITSAGGFSDEHRFPGLAAS